MSTPSIKVGQGNWGIKAGNLLGYANTDKKFVAREFTVGRLLNTATRVNASGNIQAVNANFPRIDYFGGQASLLVEPLATNLAFNSQTWATANNWGLDGVTVATATSGTTAPDGTLTANAISPTSGNVAHICFSNQPTLITFASGTIYTQSAFFKQGTGVAGRYVQLTYGGSRFAQLGFANFDLQNGVVTASGGTADPNRNARIENYGNGWYRCSFTATCTSNGDTNGVDPILITTSGATRAPSFSGTVTDVLYGWGAQLETGSVATSYIPTTTGTVTRNADVTSLTGVAGLIGQTQGTIYAEIVAVSGTNSGRVLSLTESGAPTNNRIAFNIDSTNHRLEVIVRSNGTITSGNIGSSALTLLLNGVNKIAYAYDGVAGSNALAINGSVVANNSQTFAFTQALSRVNVAILESDLTVASNQRIRAASIYQTRLPNTTTDGSPSLQSITTL